MLNELNLTPELLEKAKSATSAAAVLALAQENGITLTTEEAANYYTQLHPKEGALSDEELDNVAGGGICSDPKKKLAIDYVRTNYCDKNPNCVAYQTTNMGEKNFYLRVTEFEEKLCYCCQCKPVIDSYCRSMGWPIFEVSTLIYPRS